MIPYHQQCLHNGGGADDRLKNLSANSKLYRISFSWSECAVLEKLPAPRELSGPLSSPASREIDPWSTSVLWDLPASPPSSIYSEAEILAPE